MTIVTEAFRPGPQSGSHDRRPHVEQISPDKGMCCRCTTAPLAYAPEPLGFDMLCCLAPGKSAFCGVRVPQLAALPRHSGYGATQGTQGSILPRPAAA